MTVDVVFCPSPNFNERAAGVPLRYIVLHYTDMIGTEAAIKHLCDPETKVSAHYVVAEDGSVTRLVDETRRAWHAGVSFWRGEADMNSASIGIELVNPGHTCGYRAFPASQIHSLVALLREVVKRNRLDPLTCLLSHAEIAPDRKKDPGELFPWAFLAREGLGFWPEALPADAAPMTEAEKRVLLRSIGFNIPTKKDETDNLFAIETAFMRRYCPEDFMGGWTQQASAKLRNLARTMVGASVGNGSGMMPV